MLLTVLLSNLIEELARNGEFIITIIVLMHAIIDVLYYLRVHALQGERLLSNLIEQLARDGEVVKGGHARKDARALEGEVLAVRVGVARNVAAARAAHVPLRHHQVPNLILKTLGEAWG